MIKSDYDRMAENAGRVATGYAFTSAEIEKRLQPLGKIMADWYEKYGWMFQIRKKKSVFERIKMKLWKGRENE